MQHQLAEDALVSAMALIASLVKILQVLSKHSELCLVILDL